MDNWYSKEFISSSQTAARLVFNINNCVNLSKVLQLRPNRPPDAKGRESFVYIMDGAVVRSIKDLPIDELTPWNSKKCKSSTRFSSVQFDGEKNSLVFNRYIISDAANVEKPECLLACYYCKHPVFDLVKKIYYACDANRERCLPGTFVIFIYEFAHAEALYRTYGAYRISANHTMVSLQQQSQTPSLSTSHQPCQDSHPQHVTNSIQRKFEEAPIKIEDFILDDHTADDGYDMDSYLQETPNTSCLDDLLEACNSASLKRTAVASLETSFPIADSTPVEYFSQLKRVKRSNSEQPDQESDTSLKSRSVEESATHYRHFFTTTGLMENFRKNCLCRSEEIAVLLDGMDDYFVKYSDSDNTALKTNDFFEKEVIRGGCALLNSTFPVKNLYFTILWFRNPTFLDSNDVPLIHPVASLISTQAHNQSDDQQYLLNQLSMKLEEEGEAKGICRSVIANCVSTDSDYQINSPLFSFPCVRLVPIDQMKHIIHEKVITLDEKELFQKIEEDLFLSGSGLLNSFLSFEQFVRKLRMVEKGWPNGFRIWFREKSGWIYERSSLVAHIKAGFTRDSTSFNMCAALASLEENLRQNLTASNNEFGGVDSSLSLETAISTMEQTFTDLLVRAVQCVISSTANQQIDVKIHPTKAHLWIGAQKWAEFTAQERQECLSNLGLSALSVAGTISANPIDPLIFRGLSRSHKMDLLSQANLLDVLSLPDNGQRQRFIVENSASQHAFYIKNVSGSVKCQCQIEAHPFQVCEHILSVVIKDNNFARRVVEMINQNRGRTTNPVNGLQLDSSPLVEIICYSSNGTGS